MEAWPNTCAGIGFVRMEKVADKSAADPALHFPRSRYRQPLFFAALYAADTDGSFIIITATARNWLDTSTFWPYTAVRNDIP